MDETLQAPTQTFDMWGEPTAPNYRVLQTGSVYEPTIYGYQDEKGNIWSDLQRYGEDGPNKPQLLLKGEVANDPYIYSAIFSNTNPNKQEEKIDFEKAQKLYDLKQSNPNEFYKEISTKLTDKIYDDWKYNNSNSTTTEARNLLEGIKEYDPASYYKAKLTDLGRSVGWQIGQNRNDRNAPFVEEIQKLAPEAIKAGLTPEQIDSLIGGSVNSANIENQQRIINEQQSGNYWTENLLGALKVGGLALGAYGIDQALAAGAAAAAEGAGGVAAAEGSTASALPSLSWTAPEIGGSATGSTFGSLNAALPAAGSVGGAGAGMSAALPSGVMIGDGTLGTVMGATYMEAAPGQLALDAFGNAIPASSVGFGGYAPTGTSLSDILNAADKVRKGVGAANSIVKMVGGGNTKTGGTSGGIDLSKLANAVRGPSFEPMQVASIQSKNPFLFNTPGQTQASEGMYDVSGSNLANALRKP